MTREALRLPFTSRVGWCVVALAFTGGCATHQPRPPADLSPTFERYIAKVRQVAADARPLAREGGTLEAQDPGLAAARLLLAAQPTAAHHRLVAEHYARLGVLDAAYTHFHQALRLAPKDAASFDGRARIWRDWGFPELGMNDARRAIYYAPTSPVPENTLGTLLMRLGQFDQARGAFERALSMDGSAAYALNNLCYVGLRQGRSRAAIEACDRALQLEPDFMAARNNLGLAYGGAGDWAAASRAFAGVGPEADSQYNLGVALLATRHVDAARRAFARALGLRPGFAKARRRALQAQALAAPPAPISPDSTNVQAR